MSLPRRSLRNAAAIIANFQLRAPETTSGWIRFNEAVTTVATADQLDTEQETPTTPVIVVAPDRELLPYLNIFLNTVYKFNSFINGHQFKYTQDLDTKIKNYEAILNEFIHNIMGTLPRITVDNFDTDVGNELIEKVFRGDRELALYFSFQYDKWEEVRDIFGVGGEVSYDNINLDLRQGSAKLREELIKSIKLLKEHIEKEHPHFTPRAELAGALKKSIKRRRKKSIKRRRKKSIKRRRKKSIKRRRKKKSRRNRCK
jgi:hypothetical protein